MAGLFQKLQWGSGDICYISVVAGEWCGDGETWEWEGALEDNTAVQGSWGQCSETAKRT